MLQITRFFWLQIRDKTTVSLGSRYEGINKKDSLGSKEETQKIEALGAPNSRDTTVKVLRAPDKSDYTIKILMAPEKRD